MIAADKVLHLKGGVLVAALLACVVVVAQLCGSGWAVVLGSVALAWGVERYQAIRREGVASDGDMVASALPGVLLGVAIEVWMAWP